MKKICIKLDVHFPKENNTELSPVYFYPYFPLHTLKVKDILSRISRCNFKQKKVKVILSVVLVFVI